MRRRRFLAGGATLGLALAGVPAAARSLQTRDSPPVEPFHFGVAGYDVDVAVEADVEDGAPVSVAAGADGDAIDADEGVAIRVAATNDGDDEVRVWTGPPRPFGALRLFEDGDDRSVLAWSDGYGPSERERWEQCRRTMVWPDSYEATPLDPGESVAEAFRLTALTHGLQPGTYEGGVGFGVSRGDGDDEEWWSASVRATVEIEAREPPEAAFERSLSAEARNADGFDGRLRVEVLEPFTETHPGLLEVTLTSEWEEAREVETLRRFPFGRFVGEDGDGNRLVLQSADMYAPGYVRRDDEWLSTVVPCEEREYRRRAYLDPGESVTGRYVVAAHPEDGSPPAGDYEFTARYETDGEDGLTAEEQAADLGVVLALGEAPEGYESATTPRDAASNGGAATATPTATQTEAATPNGTATETPTPDVTPTGTDSSTGPTATEPTPTETSTATAAGPGTPARTGPTDGGSDGATRPGPAAQSGFGVGAAVAALAAWLYGRGRRDA